MVILFNSTDSSTSELPRLRLKIAGRLAFTPVRYGDEIYFHLEDYGRSQFFRLGYAEYVFVSLLDGTVTVAGALAETARSQGQDALSESRAIDICHWLISHELASAAGNSAIISSRKTESASGSSLRINPFFTQIPLWKPGALISRLVSVLGWLYQPAALFVWALLLLYAGASLFGEWTRIVTSASHVVSVWSWWWLAASWVVLKLLHELSHGMACCRFGGRVGPMGIILILFVPLAYIDVTDSTRFHSKWRRIAVAGAGMYMEGWIAGFAAICWLNTRSEFLSTIFYDLVIVSGISTLLFNANPFIRSDGYYMLADFLEIPSLATRGTASVKSLFQHWFFGIRSPGLKDVTWRTRAATIYGLCALVWRFIVGISLILTASLLWHGAGIAVAVMGLLAWGYQPIRQGTRFLRSLAVNRPISFLRGLAASGLLVALFWGILTRVPYPADYQSPGIVEFADAASVRADTAGFVRAIHVVDGQSVKAGDVLLEMQNEDVEAECRDLALAIEQANAVCRIARHQRELGTLQMEEASRRSFEKQLAERSAQLNSLTVRAPRDGRVIARQLKTIRDKYYEEGAELLRIGDEQSKELQISISQDDIDAFQRQSDVAVQLRDGSRFVTQLSTLSPRGSVDPPDEALCASYGGPLAVVQRPVPSTNDERKSEYQFTEPRFLGVCPVPDSYSTQFAAGTLGWVSPATGHRTLGEVGWQYLEREFRSLWRARDVN